MRAIVRLLGIAMSGVALCYAGVVNGMYLKEPRMDAPAVVVAAIAMALVILVWVTTGLGRDDARVRVSPSLRWPIRILSILVVAHAFLGLGTFFGAIRPTVPDETRYHNDAIALNECAARLVLEGHNPYASLDLFACYDALGIGADRTTPLRRGVLADVDVYPTQEELDAAWTFRRMYPNENVEFVWRPSYPALSFLVLVPWTFAGLDPNLLSTTLLLLAMVAVVARTEKSARGLMATTLLASLSVIAFTLGGTSDLFYAAPLAVAWLWRERRWSAVPLGIACSMKQLAWFAAPFYLIGVVASHGWREAARRGAIAAGLFLFVNVPFIVADPGAWLLGVMTPMNEPMFARGSGLVFLGTSGILPLLPGPAYLALELVAFVAGLIAAWRLRYRSPELGIMLAFVPLFFAWRSLFSYFFLLPLFAAAAVARMPIGALSAEEAREAGVVALAVSGPRRPTSDRALVPAAERSSG